MALQVVSLPAGATLPAFDLTSPGELQSIDISAFRAGKVPSDVARRMAGAAGAALKQAGAPLQDQTAGRQQRSNLALRQLVQVSWPGTVPAGGICTCRLWGVRCASAHS